MGRVVLVILSPFILASDNTRNHGAVTSNVDGVGARREVLARGPPVWRRAELAIFPVHMSQGFLTVTDKVPASRDLEAGAEASTKLAESAQDQK